MHSFYKAISKKTLLIVEGTEKHLIKQASFLSKVLKVHLAQEAGDKKYN